MLPRRLALEGRVCVREVHMGERIVSTESSSPTNNSPEYVKRRPTSRGGVCSKTRRRSRRCEVRKVEKKGRREAVRGEGE